MERFIADLVKNYESGKVDRREFCTTVALAATVYAAGDAANAQAPRGLKMIGINHLSYACPDYAKARDWYASIDRPQNPRTGGRPKPEAVIEHIGYTVANFDRERAKADLIAMGVKNVRDGGLYSLHMEDPFGYDVQISGLENNALTDG